MRWTAVILACCSGLLLPAATPEMEAVRAQPNLERRSGLALDKADEHIGSARTAWEAGKVNEFKSHLQESGELTELCYQSLQESGKRARRSPKWFKHAEQKLLAMIRRTDSLNRDVPIEDRPAVEALQKRLHEVHDQILQDIMTKK